MITNPASILEMASNFAVNACFGLASTKWGHARQGKLMGASVAIGLVDMFVQLFLGGSGTAEPQMVGVTTAELKGSLEDLRSELGKDLFHELEVDKLAHMQTLEQSFKQAWAAACQAQRSASGDPVVDDQLNADWASYYDAFKAETSNRSTIDVCNWLADHDSFKWETLDLYMMAAGLYINICQLCLLLEFQEIIKDVSNTGPAYQADLAQWRLDLRAWRSRHAAWSAQQARRVAAANPGFGPGHKTGGFVEWDAGDSEPEPVMPPQPGVPITCFDQLTTSEYAKDIRDWVGVFIAYADPIVTEMEKKLADRKAQLSIRPSKLIVKIVPGTPYCTVTDGITGFVGKRVPPELAERQLKLEAGMIRAGLLAHTDPKILAVSDAEVKSYREIIQNWQSCQRNYAEQ